ICGPARPHPLARALTRSYRPRGRRGFSLSSLSSVCLVVYASELYVLPGFSTVLPSLFTTNFFSLSVLLVPYGTPCLYYPPWLLFLSSCHALFVQ
ncbi:hypothetical protein GBAR_LOCUS8974, partial [Geodia barretti]